MIDPFKSDLEQGTLILKRFALARAVIVLIVAASCITLHVRANAEMDRNTAYLYSIFLVALIESLMVVFLVAAGYKPTIRFSSLLLCADLVFISAIIVLTGGSKSVFAFLYIAAILSTSILLSFNWSVLIATVCSALFVLIMVLEQNGLVMPASAFRWQGPPMLSGDVVAYTSMKVFGFYLTAFLAGYLSHRLGLLQSLQQNILNSFSSGFISINLDHGVTFLNVSAATLLGHRRSELIGKPVSSVFAVADGETNPLDESGPEHKECQSKEVTLVRSDGKRIPIGITVSHLRDHGKKLMGAVASFTDLTELKRMEERLRRADRLAAIGEMSTSLAHEIRNPVASIRGAVQELSEHLMLDGTDSQLMRIAMRESDQLSRIISCFLEFVDTGPREDQQFDVNELMEEITRIAQQHLARHSDIRIREEFPKGLGHVVGDRARIKEAMLNVIQNAVDAMSDGGDLHICACRNGNPSGNVTIRIKDEGKGLSLEGVQKIFDPFYTTKPQGIGLGMAIAHKIIDSHRGSIDVESTEGKGTTVTIGLPRED